MQITIQMELDASYDAQRARASFFRALAAALESSEGVEAAPTPAPAVVVPMGEALPEADAPGVKGRARKRKPAEEPAPSPEAKARDIGQLEIPEPAPVTAPVAAPVAAPEPAPAADTPTMTLEEFRTTMRGFLGRGLPLAQFQALIESYGVRSATEIPVAEWPAVLQKAEGMLPS
jgi:hypothetical protein